MKLARSILVSVFPLALLLAPAGCAEHKAAAPPALAPTSVAPVATTTTTSGAPRAEASVETPGLHVSEEIARACALPKQDVAPSFEYDSAAIGEQDRAVLAAIAKCLSEGPLKGRGLALTGRADPRGEPEYNMSLGESRADSVSRYLHDLGVQADRLRATSRGEIDATGTDEQTWAHDRRVDIDLAN
jgi:peptidoglycan-associated lipoprotein